MTDIVAEIEQYVELHRRGKHLAGLCPFHEEKTPSFVVNAKTQTYYCFGCLRGGNVTQFRYWANQRGLEERRSSHGK